MTELLAPAGGMEALKAAVENGADAVYLGAKSFNARRGADNFDGVGLREAIEYCHLRGVLAYVTLNTLVREDELPELDRQIAEIAEAGADAAIVQDLGVAASVRTIAPEVKLHASTQMAVHNHQGVEFLRGHGFSRAVLAREMPLSEIERCAGLGVELEAFCHGALCVGCSGQCLFSSLVGARSGNRGMCAQPCRLPYRLREKEGYLLSTRDLMLVDELGVLREAGVSSFKIEGRLKRAEYVAIATAVYRRALDGEAIADADREALLQIFNRGGFSRGYLRGARDSDIVFSERPNHLGVLVAENGRLLKDVQTEDALVARGAEDVPVKFEGRAGGKIGVRGRIFRLVDDRQMRRARESYEQPRRFAPVSASLALRIGEPMRLTVSDGAFTFAAEGDAVARAEKRPFDPDRAREQIQKTGGTAYRIDAVEIGADEMAFAAMSQLNALRRSALEGLSALRLEPYKKRVNPAEFPAIPRPEASEARLIAQSADPDVLLRALNAGADEIALAPDDLRVEALDRALDRLAGHPFALALPQVAGAATLECLRRWAQEHADRIAATYRTNASHLALDWPGEKRAGYPLNLFNSRAIAEAGVPRYVPSVELTARQIASLPGEKELVVWGRVPLMQLRHCPLRAHWALPGRHADCRRCDLKAPPSDGAPETLNGLSLTDRLGVGFPLRRVASGEGCVIEVLNSVPLSLMRRFDRLPRASGWLLLLDAGEPVEAIVQAHRAALDGERPDLRAFDGLETTTGHYFRGVE